MRNTDARRLDHKTLTELRKRAITQVQEGESPEVVARMFNISRASIYNWISLYRHGGWGALDAKKRGGRPRKLSGSAMKWIYETVTMKNPIQLQFPFALWTCPMIAKLIKEKYGVKLNRTSVSRLLKHMGLTVQRPLWRAYQQNPELVEEWMKNEYPKIVKSAKKNGADIYFGDEAGVRSDYHSGRTWSERGKTPVVTTTGARFGMNLISAISPRGQMKFMVVKKRVNAGVFIDFLKRLVHGHDKKIFLIVDGHPSHKAKKVERYVASLKGQLRIFLLPPYSPELNPDELVWNDLKNNCIGKKPSFSLDQLKRNVIGHLRSLQKKPRKIISFFHAPTTPYAAI